MSGHQDPAILAAPVNRVVEPPLPPPPPPPTITKTTTTTTARPADAMQSRTSLAPRRMVPPTRDEVAPATVPLGGLLASTPQPGPSPSGASRSKASGESATATVENDVRDAFKQFASEEKLRLLEQRRKQAKHDKDIKLNDLMKFSQNFKLNTPVPRDLVPILTKDKDKQEEIIERAQRHIAANRAASAVNPTPMPMPRATTVMEPDPPRPSGPPPPPPPPPPTTTTTTTTTTTMTTSRSEVNARHMQAVPSGRQTMSRGRGGPPGHNMSNHHHNNHHHNNHHHHQSTRPPPPPPPPPSLLPGRVGPGLSQRLANVHQLNRGPSAGSSTIPSPLSTHDVRQPPLTGLAAGGPPDSTRFAGVPTPTSTTSTHFNAKALEFKPNPAAMTFTPTGQASATSSPTSHPNGPTPARTPTPSGFFGGRKPLPASERPSIVDGFNPIERFRKEARETKEDCTSNGGIRPAHKTGPRWDVAEANKDKVYTEMFEKVPFSTQSISPQHPQYAAPQLPHQHQLPFHLQHGGPPVLPQPTTPHPGPHHLHPQQPHHQPHHHHHHHHHHPPVAIPHHFDDHRMNLSTSSSSVGPSPRLQPVHMAYHSPMTPHAQVVYGQPMPHYGMGPAGPPMTPMRQYPSAPHFLSQHGAHMAAPLMTHSPSGGHMTGLPQGLAAPFNQQMPVYSTQPMQAYIHHGGPPPAALPPPPPPLPPPQQQQQQQQQQPPPPSSNGYPSPGRGAPLMVHQGSQPGQQVHPMMMFGMGPGQPGQHVYLSPPPGQGTSRNRGRSGWKGYE